MRTQSAFGLVLLSGSLAMGDVTSLNGDLDIEAEVDAGHQGASLNDYSYANIHISPDSDSGFLLDFNADRTTGIFAGGTGGLVESSTSVMSDTQMYLFSHGMSNRAAIGMEANDYAESEHGLRLNSLVDFEKGDQVLITMRIEYEAVSDGQLWAQLRVSGIAGQGPVVLEVSDPTEAGFVEFSTLTTVDGSRAFFFDADMESRLEASGDRRHEQVDGFSMSASFVLVPAPGGTLMLGGLGLFAGRRGRSYAVRRTCVWPLLSR